MGTVIPAWKSQLSRTKKLIGGMLRGTATELAPPLTTPLVMMGPEACETSSDPDGKENSVGEVKLLRRVYFPSTFNRGRNPAHASSRRAAAPRRFSSEAFAL